MIAAAVVPNHPATRLQLYLETLKGLNDNGPINISRNTADPYRCRQRAFFAVRQALWQVFYTKSYRRAYKGQRNMAAAYR